MQRSRAGLTVGAWGRPACCFCAASSIPWPVSCATTSAAHRQGRSRRAVAWASFAEVGCDAPGAVLPALARRGRGCCSARALWQGHSSGPGCRVGAAFSTPATASFATTSAAHRQGRSRRAVAWASFAEVGCDAPGAVLPALARCGPGCCSARALWQGHSSGPGCRVGAAFSTPRTPSLVTTGAAGSAGAKPPRGGLGPVACGPAKDLRDCVLGPVSPLPCPRLSPRSRRAVWRGRRPDPRPRRPRSCGAGPGWCRGSPRSCCRCGPAPRPACR